MCLRSLSRVAALTLGFGLSPALFGVSFTWDYSGANNPGTVGNSLFFTPATGGPSIKATAWYIDSGGLFQRAALGQYSHGLGVCYPGEDCSNPNHQTDNNGFDDFVLLEFSAPVDPATARVTTTTSGGGDTDVSFWLGGTSAAQNMNLAGTSVAGLTGLGFGARVDDSASNLAQNAFRDVTIPPTGVYVNKMLFGAKYLDSNDYFKLTSMGGSTFDGGGGSIPEPSTVVLLGTVTLFVLNAVRKRGAAGKVSEQ